MNRTPSIDNTNKFSLDETDGKIVSLLQQNGRISNVDLAKQVKLSPPPCLRRLRALERAKVIVGYKAQVDYRKLGYEIQAVIIVRLYSQDCDTVFHFSNTIVQLNDVIGVKATIDYSCFIIFNVSKNIEEYSSFLKTQIQNNKYVRSFETYMIDD